MLEVKNAENIDYNENNKNVRLLLLEKSENYHGRESDWFRLRPLYYEVANRAILRHLIRPRET